MGTFSAFRRCIIMTVSKTIFFREAMCPLLHYILKTVLSILYFKSMMNLPRKVSTKLDYLYCVESNHHQHYNNLCLPMCLFLFRAHLLHGTNIYMAMCNKKTKKKEEGKIEIKKTQWEKGGNTPAKINHTARHSSALHVGKHPSKWLCKRKRKKGKKKKTHAHTRLHSTLSEGKEPLHHLTIPSAQAGDVQLSAPFSGPPPTDTPCLIWSSCCIIQVREGEERKKLQGKRPRGCRQGKLLDCSFISIVTNAFVIRILFLSL